MERKSKTQKEIYMEIYDNEKFSESKLFIAEAMGYLKCLSQFFPAEEWITKEMSRLFILLISFDFIRG